VREGKLTAAQAEELKALASRDLGILAINILMSFGAIGVAAGILALNPSFATGAVIGVGLVLIGLVVSLAAGERWRLLGTAGTVIGALLLSGGMIGVLDGGFSGFAFTAALLLVLAVVIRSSFLTALVPLALAAALGSSTGYFHATYMLIVSEPTITIAFFAALALTSHLVSTRIDAVYEGLAIVFARMSLLLVNFGFWVGSLWGDYPGESWAVGGMDSWTAREAWQKSAPHVPDSVFIPGWAALAIGVGIWAARANRRWVVTAAASFAAINFYTNGSSGSAPNPGRSSSQASPSLPSPWLCGATIPTAPATSPRSRLGRSRLSGTARLFQRNCETNAMIRTPLVLTLSTCASSSPTSPTLLDNFLCRPNSHINALDRNATGIN
jgi:iron complex transport system permease protein